MGGNEATRSQTAVGILNHIMFHLSYLFHYPRKAPTEEWIIKYLFISFIYLLFLDRIEPLGRVSLSLIQRFFVFLTQGPS